MMSLITQQVNQGRLCNLVARPSDGVMTIVFKASDCDSLVIKDVSNRGSFHHFHQLMQDVWLGGNLTNGGPGRKTSSAPQSQKGQRSPIPGRESGHRKIQLR